MNLLRDHYGKLWGYYGMMMMMMHDDDEDDDDDESPNPVGVQDLNGSEWIVAKNNRLRFSHVSFYGIG
jgi:hypothetical protein